MIINTHTLAHWHTLANRCHRSSIHRRGARPNCQRRYRQRTPESRPSPQSHWVSDVTSATKTKLPVGPLAPGQSRTVSFLPCSQESRIYLIECATARLTSLAPSVLWYLSRQSSIGDTPGCRNTASHPSVVRMQRQRRRSSLFILTH